MTRSNESGAAARDRRFYWLVTTALLLAAALVAVGLLAHCRLTRAAPRAADGTPSAVEAPIFGGLPRSSRPLTVLRNTGYWVGYDEARRDPAWVGFRVRGAAVHARLPRPAFEVDERTEAHVRPDDYTRSGYDRGHMAPNYAIGSRLGPEAQRETFLMSNICPQRPSLNRGLWQRLEARESGPERGDACWAEALGEVDVVVGPVFSSGDPLLPSRVEVPHAFYRIVVDPGDGTPGHARVLAFLVPNENEAGNDAPERYLTSVDEIETETGLDFMPEVAQPLQEELEGATAKSLWP